MIGIGGDLRVVLLHLGQFYAPKNIWQCLESFLVVITKGALVSSGQKPEMLLNTLHYTGQLRTTKNSLTQIVKSAAFEKPCPRAMVFPRGDKLVNDYLSLEPNSILHRNAKNFCMV